MTSEAPRAPQAPQASQAPQATALGVQVTPGLMIRRILLGLATYVLLRAKGIITLPLFTRILGPEGMGIIALSGATANLVWPLLVLGLNTGLAVQAVHFRSRDEIRDAHSSVILTTICTTLAGGALLAGVILFFGPAIGLARLRPYAFAVAAFVVTAGLKEVGIVVPQIAQRTAMLTALNLTVGFGGTALAALLIIRGNGPVAAVWAEAASLLVGSVWAITHTFHRFGFTFKVDRALLKQCLAVALPILPVSAGEWVLQALDSYFLAYFHGDAAVGVYSVAYTLASVVLAVSAGLNFVFLPSAAAVYQHGIDRFSAFTGQTLRLTSFVLGLATVASAMLAPWGVRLLAGSGFDGAAAIVPWVVAGYSAWTVGKVMQAVLFVVERRSQAVAWTYGITTALNVVLNLLLIPKGSMLGAAVATTLSYVAGFLLMRRIACKIVPGLKEWRTLLLPWLPAAALMPLAMRWSSPVGAPLWDPAARVALLVVAYVALGLLLGILRRSDWKYLGTGGESHGGSR